MQDRIDDAASISPNEDVPTYCFEDFLRDPTAPGRLAAAEPWGDRALTLDIPGGPYALAGLDPVSQREAIDRFSSVVSVTPTVLAGAILTEVRCIDAGLFRPVQNPLYPFELAQTNSRDLIDLVGWRLVARLSIVSGFHGYLGVAQAEDLVKMGDLENYLRFLVAYGLLVRGGLLLHSSCVVCRGEAYLFVGRSGAGKTTIASQAQRAGLQVLSDDMNALMSSNKPQVHMLPFSGTLGQRPITGVGPYPLRAVCWLSKGEGVICKPMAAAQALARLIVCAPYLNADPFRVEPLLNSLASLTANVPMLSLTFPREAEFLPILERLESQAPRVL